MKCNVVLTTFFHFGGFEWKLLHRILTFLGFGSWHINSINKFLGFGVLHMSLLGIGDIERRICNRTQHQTVANPIFVAMTLTLNSTLTFLFCRYVKSAGTVREMEMFLKRFPCARKHIPCARNFLPLFATIERCFIRTRLDDISMNPEEKNAEIQEEENEEIHDVLTKLHVVATTE